MTARGENGACPAPLLLLVCGLWATPLVAGAPDTARLVPALDGAGPERGAPHAPTCVSPSDGATYVSPQPDLRVRVSDPENQPLDVTFLVRPRMTPAAPFTFVHWTDTQHYAESHPEIFETVTRWIHAHAAERNVVFAPMSGDIVDNADQPVQWENAERAVRLLEPALAGYPDGIPFGVLPGNHDQFPREHADSTAAYNEFFGVSRFADRAYYGGSFDGVHNDHNFVLFEAERMRFVSIFIGFDLDANPAVLAWADSLLTAHADRRAIVVSHYLIELGDQAPFGEQGQATYDALKHHENLFLMLCGDRHGEGRRVDFYDGHRIDTLLANFQDRSEGGEGWLRLLEFRPADDEIRVSTYSPWLDRFETDADSEFTLPYDLDAQPPFVVLGTVRDVPSGTDVSLSWPDRDPDTEYEWMVTVRDGCHVTRGPTWTFATEPEIGFSAYNDLAWSDGQPTAAITRITSPNGGSMLPSTGSLVDHSTELSTPVVLTVTGGVYDGSVHGTTGVEPPQSSDAYAAFGERVSHVGHISYVDEADTSLTLTLAGMDTGRTYELVFYSDRDAFGWDEASRVTLSGVERFVNRSSVGLDDLGAPLFDGPDDPSTRLPADNDSGWVAAFSAVESGEDGEVALTVEWDGTPGNEYRGKYGSALFVREFLGPRNRTPVVLDPGDQVSEEGDTVAVSIAATDPDEDGLIFAAVGLPPSLSIDPAAGTIGGVVDSSAATGSPYVVNVSATDVHGASEWTGFVWWVEEAEDERTPGSPAGFVFRPSLPNPFRPATRIRFQLDTAAPLRIRVFDVGGRLVRDLFEDRVVAGDHVVVWDGRTGAGPPAGAGVYFLAIDSDGRRLRAERLVRLP